MSAKKIGRRDILRAGAIAAAGVAVAACQPKVVEKIVEKTVIVEKPVEKEKIVEREKEVTKVVEKVVEKEKEKVVTATPSPCKPDWDQKLPPVYKRYDPVVEVSFPFPNWAQFPPGYDYTNNPFYNFVVQEMGLRYTIHTQTGENLIASIAAGNPPDFFVISDPDFNKLIDDGALAEIREIWEKTATQECKEIHNYPNGKNWLHCRRGEELYGLDLGITDKVFCGISWIRKDWLEKAGMSMPKTIDDWDKTLHAFKDQKLSKHGLTAGKDLFHWGHNTDKIFGAYGVMPKYWRNYGDGKLRYDSLTPAVKDVLALLSKWYKDELLAPDFYTFDWTKGFDQFDAEEVGIITAAPMFMTSRIVGVERLHPGAAVSTMPLPAGPEGKIGRNWTSPVFHAWVYRKGIEPIKVEATINHLNWERFYHIHGPEDAYQCYGPLDDMGSDGLFLQGYDWDFNAKCEIERGKFSTGDGMMDVGYKHATYPGYQRHADINRQKLRRMDPAKLNTAQKFLIADQGLRRQEDAYEVLFTDEAKYEIANEWLGINTERMNKLLPDLAAMEDEYFMSIIIGNRPLSDFDKFVSDWHKNGGDDVTADVNAWYAQQPK